MRGAERARRARTRSDVGDLRRLSVLVGAMLLKRVVQEVRRELESAGAKAKANAAPSGGAAERRKVANEGALETEAR